MNDGRRLTVSLGGKDLIVNTEVVGRYLANSSTNRKGGSCVGAGRENKDCISLCSTEDAWKQRKWEGNGLDVLWFGQLDHGQVFAVKRARTELVKVVRGYCESV